MNNADLVTMIGNLSRSLFPFQFVISGFSYVLGIAFFLIALQKFKKIGSSTTSHERLTGPIAYLLCGVMLIFLPSAVSVMSNTTFGVGNILQYATFNQFDIYSSMGMVIRTAGLLWFIRGAVLLTHASEPGTKNGPKGFMFLMAGILSINFDNTVAFLGYVMSQIATLP